VELDDPMSIWSGRSYGIPCCRRTSINNVDRCLGSFINASTSSVEAERGGPRTGSSTKGAGGEAVGPGHDIVLQMMKGWKMSSNYKAGDGGCGDGGGVVVVVVVAYVTFDGDISLRHW
jgi:hypothetical protein